MDFPPAFPVAGELYYGKRHLAKRIERGIECKEMFLCKGWIKGSAIYRGAV